MCKSVNKWITESKDIQCTGYCFVLSRDHTAGRSLPVSPLSGLLYVKLLKVTTKGFSRLHAGDSRHYVFGGIVFSGCPFVRPSPAC